MILYFLFARSDTSYRMEIEIDEQKDTMPFTPQYRTVLLFLRRQIHPLQQASQRSIVISIPSNDMASLCARNVLMATTTSFQTTHTRPPTKASYQQLLKQRTNGRMERLDAIHHPNIPLHRRLYNPTYLQSHSSNGLGIPVHDGIWSCGSLSKERRLFPSSIRGSSHSIEFT